MNCFFYISGNSGARLHGSTVLAACFEFLETHSLANKSWVVEQEHDGDLDIGVNLEGDAGPTFESDVLELLEWLRTVAEELNVSFIAGTDGEDRVSIDPGVPSDIKADAAFLSHR